MTKRWILGLVAVLLAGGLGTATIAHADCGGYFLRLAPQDDGTLAVQWAPEAPCTAPAPSAPTDTAAPTDTPTPLPPTDTPTAIPTATFTALITPTPPATYTPDPTQTPQAVATANPLALVRSVPDQYATISAAVAAAAPGDTISVHAGVYVETVTIPVAKPGLTLQAAGDGMPWIDGQCTASNDLVLHASDFTMRGMGLKRTLGATFMTGDITGQPPVARMTLMSNTFEDYNCDDSTAAQNQAGIAVWYGGPGHHIVGNTITRRVEVAGAQAGYGDGIWFKSDGTKPNGGGHVITDNTITGGYDGIGGETESSAYSSLDRDSLIARNHVMQCGDDGIQVDGGDVNITVDSNVIDECGDGISFTPLLLGPLTVTNNVITSSTPGILGALQCFKVGDAGTGFATLTNNVCTVGNLGDGTENGRLGDGIQQTNSGMSGYLLSNNSFTVARYLFEFTGTPKPGSQFDGDCLSTSDPSRFVKWANTAHDLAWLQSQGFELHATTGPCGGGGG